jgi:hypothetical protein
LLLPGPFDDEHIFRIEALARTRFTQAERFSGILVRAFRTTVDKTELGVEQMNTALKAQAEARYSRSDDAPHRRVRDGRP